MVATEALRASKLFWHKFCEHKVKKNVEILFREFIKHMHTHAYECWAISMLPVFDTKNEGEL